MRDAELVVYNAGRRLFDQAADPVSVCLHNEIWPAEWLTPDETRAAARLVPVDRWHWLRQGFTDAMVTDAQQR